MSIKLYNKKQIFSNHNDSKDELEKILQKHFRQVEIKMVGTVALFSATQPIMQSNDVIINSESRTRDLESEVPVI